MSLITRFSNWVNPRTPVTSASLAESVTVEGIGFENYFDEAYLTENESKYFLYKVPEDADFTLALQSRIFKAFNGDADLEILWDVESYTEGTEAEVFNKFNKYAVNSNQISVQEVTSVVLGSNYKIREPDFITASGVGTNSRGSLSIDSGFRGYVPGTYFIARVTNRHNADNRILLSYSWAEVPANTIKLEKNNG